MSGNVIINNEDNMEIVKAILNKYYCDYESWYNGNDYGICFANDDGIPEELTKELTPFIKEITIEED